MSKQKMTIDDLIEFELPKNKIRGKVSMVELIARKRIKLICDNPQCGLPIETNEIAYNAEHNEFYHPDYCPNEAIAYKAWETGKVQTGDIDYISRDEALRLKVMMEKGKE